MNFDNQRTYGIEIEAFNCGKEIVADALRERGIRAEVTSRRHDLEGIWKVTHDGSIIGHASFEIVSPILNGEQGLRDVKTVCEVLNALDVKVNRSCGLHVHHDADDFRSSHFTNLFYLYKKAESAIDSLVPRSRRDGNTYCKSLRRKTERRLWNDRYHKLNLGAYEKHGTVEFRQHGGTIDCNKIINWIKLTQLMVNDAVTNPCVSRNVTLTWDRFKTRLGIGNGSTTTSVRTTFPRGIGGYIMSHLLDGSFDNMSNGEIAFRTRTEFPNARTTAKSVAWYKHKIRSENMNAPVHNSTPVASNPLATFFDRRREALS